MIGQTIHQYTILEHIGEGGMGVVYKAQDNKLNRFVALKFLPHHLAKGSVEQSRFMQEAQAVAVLNHPNICVIHDVREEEGKQFIVMEYVEGATIRETVQKGTIKLDTAIDYALQIAEALEEAHSKGIVHRDIKADNIMINSKNQIKVMDFGLAKLKGSLKLTRTSSTVGTLAYMAPEQIQGGEVDPRSDIFAFGVLCFEMFSGRLPFRGEHEAAMMYSIINEDPENIQKFVPEASPELSFLLKTALEKNPDDRFQHMSDIIRDLRRLKKQSSKVNRPQYSGEYQKLEAAKLQRSDSRQQPIESKSPKKLLLYGGIGLAVVVLIIVGVLLFPRQQPIPFSTTQIARITSTGKIISTAISPDGRYISYAQYDKGQYSLWVKQLATSSNIQIRALQNYFLGDPIFSNDGNFIYYRMEDGITSEASLFKIPTLGGNSIKILADVQGPISLSPDGKQFAFRRVYPSSGNFTLVVASIDGSQQKDLYGHSGEIWVNGAPSWSPSSSIIAVPLGMWKGGLHHELIGVDVNTAEITQLTKQTWDDIRKVQWLSNGKGIVIEGRNNKTLSSQLYMVEYPSGKANRITNDLNDYGSTTLTNDYKTLCTVLYERELYLYVVQDGDTKKSKKITSQRDDGVHGIAVTNNELYYTSRQGGSFDIWSTSLTGENQKQITFDEYVESVINVSSKGDKLVFSSDKAGLPNIWSINIDGTSLKQLTRDAEDYRPNIDRTGEWVVFDSWMRGPQTLMKIPLKGGDRVDVTKTHGNYSCITNDGKYVVYRVEDEKRKANAIYKVPMNGGEPSHVFDLPSKADDQVSLVMRPHSNEISYIVTEDGVSNIYVRSLDGGPQKKYTNFTEFIIASFAWTSDGKSLVVARGEVRSDVVIITDEQNKTAK